MKSSEEKVNHTNNSSVQHQNSAFTVTVLLSTKVSTEVRWSMRGKTGNSRSFTERETLRKNGIVHFRSVFWFYAQGQLLCVCVCVHKHVLVYACEDSGSDHLSRCTHVRTKRERSCHLNMFTAGFLWPLFPSTLQAKHRSYVLLSGKTWRKALGSSLTWRH